MNHARDVSFKSKSKGKVSCTYHHPVSWLITWLLKLIFQRKYIALISQFRFMVTHVTFKVIFQRNDFALISQFRLMVTHVTFKVIFQRNNFVLISQFTFFLICILTFFFKVFMVQSSPLCHDISILMHDTYNSHTS